MTTQQRMTRAGLEPATYGLKVRPRPDTAGFHPPLATGRNRLDASLGWPAQLLDATANGGAETYQRPTPEPDRVAEDDANGARLRWRVRLTDQNGERAIDAWYTAQGRALDFAVKTVRGGHGVWTAALTRHLLIADIETDSVVHICTVRHVSGETTITTGRPA